MFNRLKNKTPESLNATINSTNKMIVAESKSKFEKNEKFYLKNQQGLKYIQ